MNWKEISELYPKAFHKMQEKYFQYPSNDLGEPKNTRDLYDFFDEQGINIIVAPFLTKWIYAIRHDNDKYMDDIKFSTRTQAESEAFKAAFSILEKRLEGE